MEVIFGLPGDGINGIFEALRKKQEKIRFVQVRHEEAAAFMACGYAKFTGRLGVCVATSGPGGIHLLKRPLRGQARRPARPGALALVEARAGEVRGIGYGYADRSV